MLTLTHCNTDPVCLTTQAYTRSGVMIVVYQRYSRGTHIILNNRHAFRIIIMSWRVLPINALQFVSQRVFTNYNSIYTRNRDEV